MSDHKHGEMDIAEQEKTFAGFVTWVTRGAIIIVIGLLLLAIVNG